MELAHGNARVVADGDQLFLGFFESVDAGGAEHVKGGVFEVFRVHGAVEFELCFAVGEAACVIERDAALPVLGRLAGHGRDDFVERGDGFGELTLAKGFFALALVIGWRLGE